MAPRAAPRWIVWSAGLLAALAGLWFGYDFGQRLAGAWFGVVTALNSALFCSLITGALVQRLFRRGGR